ncbi:MAG: ATP phosphoribosyltransferase regulatory subunit, partial [Erythrobacter sp. 34-65-8]
MSVTTDDLLPEGLSDRLPREAAIATRAMRAILGAMDAHGYDRVRPPLVEFEKSMAERMNGISPRRMFRFVDPSSLRTLALRSDMTVQVGRIAATSLAGAPRPLRLCYAGEVAIIRADQLDPARQRLQLGAELIGSDSVEAAAEVVELAIEALEAAGATAISVDFTLPDLVDTLAKEALPLAPDAIAAVRRELDTKDAGGLRDAGGEAYLPLL